jgi:hypothetical protein
MAGGWSLPGRSTHFISVCIHAWLHDTYLILSLYAEAKPHRNVSTLWGIIWYVVGWQFSNTYLIVSVWLYEPTIGALNLWGFGWIARAFSCWSVLPASQVDPRSLLTCCACHVRSPAHVWRNLTSATTCFATETTREAMVLLTFFLSSALVVVACGWWAT